MIVVNIVEIDAPYVGNKSKKNMVAIAELAMFTKLFPIKIVDNSESKTAYPGFADFTFYGGLYRGVNLIYDIPETHFSLTDFGSKGVYVTPKMNGDVYVKAVVTGYHTGVKVRYDVIDAEGKTVFIKTAGK